VRAKRDFVGRVSGDVFLQRRERASGTVMTSAYFAYTRVKRDFLRFSQISRERGFRRIRRIRVNENRGFFRGRGRDTVLDAFFAPVECILHPTLGRSISKARAKHAAAR